MKKITIGKVLLAIFIILAIVFIAATVLAHFYSAIPEPQVTEQTACVLALQ